MKDEEKAYVKHTSLDSVGKARFHFALLGTVSTEIRLNVNKPNNNKTNKQTMEMQSLSLYFIKMLCT